jgi:hypothetical protein
MQTTLGFSFLALIFALGGAANAQPLALPKELSGRWTFAAQNRTQTFSLSEISASDQSTFTAKLTWWTTDPSCTIRSEPIQGRITPTGIAFDSKTKCDVSFTAELDRAASGWQGKATTTSGNRAELSLRAD